MREQIAVAALEVGINGHDDEILPVLDNDTAEWMDVEDRDVPSTDLDRDNELLDEAFMSAINGYVAFFVLTEFSTPHMAFR
jgi:hypothetical protein